MSPNRIVALLTPLVFAPLAGAIATWVAENFPGVEVSSGALEEIFIAGALIALAPAAQWLHGWQKWEGREAEAAMAADAAAPPAALEPEDELPEDDELFDEELEPIAVEDDEDDLAALADLDELEDPLVVDDEEPVPAGG
jgi:hypothetical protein